MNLLQFSALIAIDALVGFALSATPATAQTPRGHAPVASGPVLSFAATTANVTGAPDSIRIDLLRWSTDAELEQLIAAWKMTGRTGRAGRGPGGRGPGGRGTGGRGTPAAQDPTVVPDSSSDPFARVAEPERVSGEPPRPTPESTLAVALKQTPTVGYLWSSEVAGYALRYAGRVAGPEGGERLVLITDRRLGKTNDLWTPVGSLAPAIRDFSVIELRLNSAGAGEGKISLSGKLVLDSAARIVVPENYDGLPVVLKNVKHRIVDAK